MGGLKGYMPAMAMIAVQTIYAVVALYTRAAFLQGLSPMVCVVYGQATATLIMAPLAFVSNWKASCKTSLGLKSFAWIFLASLVGITGFQNAYFEGLHFASATAATTMTNLMPAVTFVMATIVGLEKINIQSLRSIAKIIGTVICVSGAIALTLFKGPVLLNTKFLPKKHSLRLGNDNWLLGCLFLFGSSCFWSLWLILQVPILKSCPDHLLSTSWMCFLGTLQSAILTLSIEQNLDIWKLHSTLEYASCLFTGIANAITTLVQTWCISQRGPLFSAMFNPLGTVITAILGAVFLHEEIYIGSLIGAFTVITGLYVVLWGKGGDLQETKQDNDSKLQNDGTYTVQGLIGDSSEKANCKVDLNEPLLPDKSSTANESMMNGVCSTHVHSGLFFIF